MYKTAGFFRTFPIIPPESYCVSQVLPDLQNFTQFDNESDFENVTKSEPNVAFLSFIIQFCTLWFALNLRGLKSRKWFGRKMRTNLANFSVPITIGLMIGLDNLFLDVNTQKLRMPDGLNVTSPGEEWTILQFGCNVFFCVFFG